MLSLFHIDKIEDRKIICFGAGMCGHKLISDWNIEFMQYNILYFADNDERKWGNKIFGVKHGFYGNGIDIISTDDLKKICAEDRQILIVLTVEKYKDIYLQLKKENIKNDIICQNEFMAVMKGELMERYLAPFSEDTGFDIAWIYQQSHGWGFVDGRTQSYMRSFLEAYFKGKQLCVMLSPPKTGNTTIEESVKEYGVTVLVNHVLAGYHLFDDKASRDFFNSYVPKIIIGVREPIAQYVSLLFSISELGLAPVRRTEWRDAQEIFNKVFIKRESGDDYLEFAVHDYNAKKNGVATGYKNLLVDQFMDGQIKQLLGIDLYAYQFDKKRGYSIYEREVENGKKQQILVYKLESLNGLEGVFRDFLELDEFKFQDGNVGKNKYYADKYAEFQANFTIPKEFVEKLYQSKFIRFYYSDGEIEGFRKKWEKNIRG